MQAANISAIFDGIVKEELCFFAQNFFSMFKQDDWDLLVNLFDQWFIQQFYLLILFLVHIFTDCTMGSSLKSVEFLSDHGTSNHFKSKIFKEEQNVGLLLNKKTGKFGWNSKVASCFVIDWQFNKICIFFPIRGVILPFIHGLCWTKCIADYPYQFTQYESTTDDGIATAACRYLPTASLPPWPTSSQPSVTGSHSRIDVRLPGLPPVMKMPLPRPEPLGINAARSP